MRKPTTMEEYLYLIDETSFEAGDLLLAAGGGEDEGEDEVEPDPDPELSYASTLEQQLKDLQASITDGSYAFADEDLPFMALVRQPGVSIPFADMLTMINDTHRGGLDSGA